MNGLNIEGTKDLKAVAIMSTFNEKDIALQNIHYHIDQGFHVHVMDNWSDDDFFESISELAESSTSVTVELFPLERKENKHFLKEQLDRKAAYAVESGFDWAIHVDADEFRHSPWDGVTFLEGIKIVDSLGFNAIDFSVLEFRPTKQGFSSKINPKDFFFHFEFAKVPGAFLQIKAWKINPEKDYDLSRNGGHHIHFEGQKIFSLKFENQHFAYRSLEQIREKLYIERLPRIEEGLMKRGWHVHLVDFAVKHGVKLWDPIQLLPDSKLTREEYLIERLSGVGLPRISMNTEKIKKLYSYWKKGRIQTFENLPMNLIEDSESLIEEVKEKESEIYEIKNTLSWRILTFLLPIRTIYVKAKKKLRSKFNDND